MTFLDIPRGESVFIDANVFVYAYAADPTLGPPCRDLVERCVHHWRHHREL